MDKQIATFGETLSSIMNSKKTSVTKLCQMMNIKSQTTISRILKDSSSYNKTLEFYADLLRIDPLETNEYDRAMLADALEVNRYGKDMYRARKEMLYFINKKINIRQLTLVKVYGGELPGIKTFADLAVSYKSCASLRICAVNCIYDGVISAFSELLGDNENNGEGAGPVSIEQFIQTETGLYNEVHQFISLLPIISFKNYCGYRGPASNTLTDERADPFNNYVCVMKKSRGGEILTDIITINGDATFSVLKDVPGQAVQDFYGDYFNKMRSRYYPIKKSPEPKPFLDTLVDISRHLLSLEEAWQQISIKPDFCFYSINLEIIKKMCSEEVLNDPHAEQLMDLHTKRYANYCKNGRLHTGIYTRQGIKDFIETGRLTDHLPMLRPFKRKEALDVIRNLIKISERSPLNTIHILKNDIIYNRYQYVLLNSNILNFSDSRTDYEYKNYEYIINSQHMIKVFHEFIITDLIPNHCYTREESLAMLRELIK